MSRKLPNVSARKIAANRQNALKSTGPKTPEGKAYSRTNAIKHGLFVRHWMDFQVLGEDSQEYEQLLNELFDRYQPMGRAEDLEVERIAVCWWRFKRVWRYENSVNHIAVRDVARKELARQEEYCKELYGTEEAIILELQKALEEIKATDKAPQDLKHKLFATMPELEPLWSSFERIAEEKLPDLVQLKTLKDLSPDKHTIMVTLFAMVGTIEFIEELRGFRTAGLREVALAEHIIPNREILDKILCYETAIEKSLGRAFDRLERLQRRR